MAPATSGAAAAGALHAAAAQPNAIPLALRRIAQPLLAPDQHGRTPLHIAAATGRLENVRQLLALGQAAGARGHAPDSLTPCHLAAAGGHVEVIRTLVRAGVSSARLLGAAAPLGACGAPGWLSSSLGGVLSDFCGCPRRLAWPGLA